MKKLIFLISILWLQGCSGIAALSINKNDVVGRDADSVIVDFSKKGISCGKKFSEKAVNVVRSRMIPDRF